MQGWALMWICERPNCRHKWVNRPLKTADEAAGNVMPAPTSCPSCHSSRWNNRDPSLDIVKEKTEAESAPVPQQEVQSEPNQEPITEQNNPEQPEQMEPHVTVYNKQETPEVSIPDWESQPNLTPQ